MSGITVVDIDVDPDKKIDGEETWAWLERECGVPATHEVTTGRGRHLYFEYAERLRTRANCLGKGVDVRNDGGYVVAEGSLHKSGKRYAGNGTHNLAKLPERL